MEKEKRAYFLPVRLVEALDREAKKQGYVREKLIAAAIGQFIRSSPNDRARMFEDLDHFLKSKAK